MFQSHLTTRHKNKKNPKTNATITSTLFKNEKGKNEAIQSAT